MPSAVSVEQQIDALRLRKPYSLAENEMGLQLLETALGHPQEPDVFSGALPAPSLRDIRRDRGCGASNLRGHAEHFLPREALCQP